MKPERGQPFRRGRAGRVIVLTLLALAVVVLALLPPVPEAISIPGWPMARDTVRGAYHVHSDRSDGAGTIDDIAEAAARAGLHFVILTDHGDGTRRPEAPSYRHGVLCLEAVELNTNDGHYVALGLGPTPYPLAGAAESVVEDVSRLGGFGFAAHADSARLSLQWRAWDVPFHGLEWLNADSEWRDESWSALTRAAFTYWVRAPSTLAALLDRPSGLIARWDDLTKTRQVPVLAGADAHARVGIRQRTDPDAGTWYLPVPDYASSFRVFSNHVVLDRRLEGNAATDADRLLTAIRRGRMFTVIDGLAGPGAFEFVGSSGAESSTLGDDLGLHGHAKLHARVAAPQGASLVLLKDGTVVKETNESELELEVTQPGSYRVEVVTARHSRLPWLLSNPIYVGFDRRSTPTEPVPVVSLTSAALDQARGESSPGSSTELEGTAEIAWRYRLASGVPAGQYAAVRVPVSGLSESRRVRFGIDADRPMRLWVQLRRPDGIGERWGRTVYADQTARSIDLALDTFAPIGVTSTARAALADVDSLLFVVDTVNTLPGSSGVVHVSKLEFAR